MNWNLLLTMLLAAVIFKAGTEIVHEPDCRPYPEPAAGWKAPFAIAVNDTVVEYHPNEATASRAAFRVAYQHPEDTVRIAGIIEMRFRLSDGSTCTYQPGGTR